MAVLSVVAVGCGGGDDDAASTTAALEETTTTTGSEDTTTTEAEEETTTTSAAVQITDPDDDANEDGELDPFCGEQDFGGGLARQVQCEIGDLAGEVPPGVTLIENSLFRLRTSIHVSMDGISGNLIVSRDPAGNRVYVIVFQSDVLFGSGSASIEETESFDNTAALVDREFPGSVIQVRGHTDSTGDPGSNQSLSEARAQSVRARFVELGVQSPDVSVVGFGETNPLALDDTEEGMAFNRRVEVVIRPPSG